jgi:uncharacterized protein YecT (DUF1311 family)
MVSIATVQTQLGMAEAAGDCREADLDREKMRCGSTICTTADRRMSKNLREAIPTWLD